MIKNSKWAARSTGQAKKSTIIFFKITGIATKNAAPAMEPNTEPNQPIIIINNIKNDLSMPNASPASTAPKYKQNKSAPDIPM